jgi:hypothetical protein
MATTQTAAIMSQMACMIVEVALSTNGRKFVDERVLPRGATVNRMHRLTIGIVLLGALAATTGCGSSGDDGASDTGVAGDAGVDTRHDTHPVDDTTPPDDVGCPGLGSACPAGAFVGCDSEWKGVNRWECHDGRWCAEPAVPPSFSDAACPTTVPKGGDACTPASGASGYEWCGYKCDDGEVHAMVCAGGIWCGDATATCTIVSNPDAGTDAGSDVADDSPVDSPSEAASDATSDTAFDGAIDGAIDGDAAD